MNDELQAVSEGIGQMAAAMGDGQGDIAADCDSQLQDACLVGLTS